MEEAALDGSPATSVQWVQRMGFRTVTVFDVSQTEGKPLPELVKKLTGDVAQYESMVATLRSITPFPLSRFRAVLMAAAILRNNVFLSSPT